jgi:NADPH-dependent 2,4-dienoyl-CoA reductase/sulfur reductase-like enzyme
VLANGDRVSYDGLVIATGARARRLGAIGQGERVVRTMDDAMSLRESLRTSNSIIIVGAGFLAFELATAAVRAGLTVTVVSRSMPLRAIAGPHLAGVVVDAAREAGVNFVSSARGVRLIGDGTIRGVEIDDGTILDGELVVTAAGCVPNVEWLAGEFDLTDGLVVDEGMRVAPRIVAAGDVAAWRAPGQLHAKRTPLWMSAIAQARTASASLLELAPIALPDQYAWTEVFGLDIKIAGAIPEGTAPEVADGSLAERRALLTWAAPGSGAAATIDYRLPVARLKALARPPHATIGL